MTSVFRCRWREAGHPVELCRLLGRETHDHAQNFSTTCCTSAFWQQYDGRRARRYGFPEALNGSLQRYLEAFSTYSGDAACLWAQNSITAVYRAGIMTGTSSTTFGSGKGSAGLRLVRRTGARCLCSAPRFRWAVTSSGSGQSS